MIKPKYILPSVFFLILVTVLLCQIRSSGSEQIVEAPVMEKVYTRTDSIVSHYDNLLAPLIDSSGTVGAAVVITHAGRIEYLKCFGLKKAAGNNPVDENTIFRLASVSKTVTGVLAGILDKEGMISLDDRVIDYLPGFRLKDSVNTHDLTIRHVLSHTSGLVPHAYDNLVEAGYPLKTIMDSLKYVNISDIPGKLYGYQNVIFSLYDTISEAVSGMKFNDLLQEKVFGPFGMHNASAGFQSFKESYNKALPHSRQRVLSLNDRYYNTNPAAGINASISDMGRFLLAVTGYRSQVLPVPVADTMLSPQVLSPLRRVYLRKWDGVESKHYGLGWRIIGYKGHQIGYHGGYVQGYQAEIAVCREEGLGIAFLTNSPNGVASGVVPMFLDLYFEW